MHFALLACDVITKDDEGCSAKGADSGSGERGHQRRGDDVLPARSLPLLRGQKPLSLIVEQCNYVAPASRSRSRLVVSSDRKHPGICSTQNVAPFADLCKSKSIYRAVGHWKLTACFCKVTAWQ